jgi:hypothetical protein
MEFYVTANFLGAVRNPTGRPLSSFCPSLCHSVVEHETAGEPLNDL